LFLDVSQADHTAAVALYVWNARLSSAFFEVIHHLEVLVRNAIHNQLKASQQEDGLSSWLIDPALLRTPELNAVQHVVTRLRRRELPLTDHRVIGGLPFSFWARLVGTNYDDVWKATLHGAFPHALKRNDVSGALNRVSQLRNGIAHHKAILKLPVHERHRDILDLAAAVDPTAADWIEQLSRVPELLAKRPAEDLRSATPPGRRTRS
jgi:hypothetical protein